MKRIALILAVLPFTAACNRAGNVEPSQAIPSATEAPAPVASAAAIASASAAPAASAVDSSSSLLAVGADVPDVSAPAQDGKVVRLRDLKGKPVVVYFYPKDDTPGCTIEAKGIRDQYA